MDGSDGLYAGIARMLERSAREILPFIARFAFAAVLLIYYWSSFQAKVQPGIKGFLTISPTAWRQIALPAFEAAGGDTGAIPFFPWGLVVVLGTYAEFLLPLLIVLGLFTRVAALGMINFLAVQTFVEITMHKANGAIVGMWFDRLPDSPVLDQRLLWLLLLVVLVVHGGGAISLDRLLLRRRARRR